MPTPVNVRLVVERLEDRLTPSWTGSPPTQIPVPTAPLDVSLSTGYVAGRGTNVSGEVDYIRFTAPRAGTYAFYATTTPTSHVDTFIAVFSATGTRLGYNDDYGGTVNSRLSLNLQAGQTYYFGITRYTGNLGGDFTWIIDGSAAFSAPGFQIEVRFGSGLTASQQAVFRQAAARWQSVITGDLPAVIYGGRVVDDVLIDATGAAIDGAGNVLGYGSPDVFRSASGLPAHGTMRFDTADLAHLEATGALLDVITHEMGHVLGIGTIWTQRGLLAGAGTNDPRFTGRNATAEYNLLFGRNDTGVPVENVGPVGTRDAHWRESVFSNELMTGILNASRNPLSRITVASLADLGYQVNLANAEAYSPPGSVVTAAPRSGSSPAPAVLGQSFVAGSLPPWLVVSLRTRDGAEGL